MSTHIICCTHIRHKKNLWAETLCIYVKIHNIINIVWQKFFENFGLIWWVGGCPKMAQNRRFGAFLKEKLSPTSKNCPETNSNTMVMIVPWILNIIPFVSGKKFLDFICTQKAQNFWLKIWVLMGRGGNFFFDIFFSSIVQIVTKPSVQKVDFLH